MSSYSVCNYAKEDQKHSLQHISFNHNQTSFVAGTTHGFKMFHCCPYELSNSRELNGYKIRIAVKLNQDNLFALVGEKLEDDKNNNENNLIESILKNDDNDNDNDNNENGQDKKLQLKPNKVVFWDENESCIVDEIEYAETIRSMRTRRSMLVIVLETKIHVYKLNRIHEISQLDTYPNPLGLCAIAYHGETCVIACPSLEKGRISVWRWLSTGIKPTEQVISAHESSVACIALSFNGSLLASCSENGTLIRVWNTTTSEKLFEFRRGRDAATIYSIGFSPNSKYLCCSSSKGTIHIFSITEQTPNTKSSMSFLSSYVGATYFGSEWSFCQYKDIDSPSICGFGPAQHLIYVLTMDGRFMKLSFDPEKSETCELIEVNKFFNTEV